VTAAQLSTAGARSACEITLVLPLPSPVPPSPDTSKALIAAFAERGIRFMPNRRIAAVDAPRRVATLDDGSELPYELFLGVPKHRAPAVVEASGLTEGGWVTVNPRTLEIRFPNVYAIGDIANTGTPKAGVFAEVPRAPLRLRLSRAYAARATAACTRAQGLATSSSAPAASGASTSTSSPAQSQPALTTSPASLCARTRCGLARAGRRAGSGCSQRVNGSGRPLQTLVPSSALATRRTVPGRL
jgi:hypothetical protein